MPRFSYGAVEERAEKQEVAERRTWPRVRVVALFVLMFAYAVVLRRDEVENVELIEEEAVDDLSFQEAKPYQEYCVGGVCLVSSNGYERMLGRAIGNGLFDGVILELYQETSLQVQDPTCLWVSVPQLDYEGGCKEITVTATSLGVSTLTAYFRDKPVIEFDLVAKYVRRELRDLDASDRDRYLDAIAVTHTLSDEVGKRKFGEKYQSVNWFAETHLFWSAHRECDHWHSGSGFVQQHMAFTLRFEQTLQAIDPRVCSHYWDFTIDVAQGLRCCWTRSILFSPDFFSTVDPPNDDHIVDSGRWAYTRIQSSTAGRGVNSYGLLGVPWNTNPTPFLTRSQQLFGMANYANIPYFGCGRLRYMYRTTASFYETSYIIDKFHSQVHGMVGGYWNYKNDLIEAEPILNALIGNVSSASNAISKFLWRYGLTECPSFCSVDHTPASNCSCGAAFPRIQANFPNYTSFDILNETGQIALYSKMSGGNLDTSHPNDHIWDILLEQLFNAGHIGTLTSDASPLDPLFWGVHAMQERYYQFVRYLDDYGDYTWDQTWTSWGEEHFDWSNVTTESDLPLYNKSEICFGHDGSDLILFPDLLQNQSSEYVSVKEYYEKTKAFSPYLPYVYDQLLNWTQCGWKLNGTETDDDAVDDDLVR